MDLLTLVFLGIAAGDLARWSPNPVGRGRNALAALVAGLTAGGAAALGGSALSDCALVGVGMAVVSSGWLFADDFFAGKVSAIVSLGWLSLTFAAAAVALEMAGPVGGVARDWYLDLPAPFASEISPDQFFLALSGVLFLTASANRVVRFVLQAAGTPAREGRRIKGGRILGPMERLVTVAFVVSGDPAGAAIVIAAKSLIRFPELSDGGNDDDTEYFLIGTFASLVVAGTIGVFVLAAG